MEPNTLQVHLEPGEPQFSYFVEGVDAGAMRWTLAPGESQTIIVQVSANEPGLWEWWLEFTILVEGRQLPISVGSASAPFHVAVLPDDPDAERWYRNAF